MQVRMVLDGEFNSDGGIVNIFVYQRTSGAGEKYSS